MGQKTIAGLSEYIFKIPNYQRDYAWKPKNIDDLWDDLLEAKEAENDEMGHFLGTIVLSKDGSWHEIIDGQQRLTTVFMLKFALNQKTSNPAFNQNNFYNIDGELKLKVIDENTIFFENILKQAESKKINNSLKEKIKTQGQKNLYDAFKQIWNYVGTLNEKEAHKYLTILNKMIIMWLEEKNSGRAIRMFQTVNDRGVPLLLLDKLKALLILYSNKYCDAKLDDVLNERFGNMFKNVMTITNHQASSSLADKQFLNEVESRIFRYHALSKNYEIGHYRYGADNTYIELKNLLKKIAKSGNLAKLNDWIDSYSKDLLEFTEAFLSILKRSEQEAELFKIIFILTINPYFYAIMTRLQMNNILNKKTISLLAKAEILLYGLDSVNDSKAYGLYEAVDSEIEFEKKVISSVKNAAKGTYKDIEEFLEDIYEDNFIWKKYFHYLFFSYKCKDMQISDFLELIKDKKTYSLEIEHIVPQNAFENGLVAKYGFESEDELKDIKDTFGNLIPLESSLNSKCQDKGLAAKQEFYKESIVSYNNSFASSENFLNFNKNEIIKENNKFANWAKTFFADFVL